MVETNSYISYELCRVSGALWTSTGIVVEPRQPMQFTCMQFDNTRRFPCSFTVASPGFVARRGKAGNYVTGDSRRTSGPGAAAAWWLIVLWLMQYWYRWKSCELLTSTQATLAGRLHNTWMVSWLSDLL